MVWIHKVRSIIAISRDIVTELKDVVTELASQKNEAMTYVLLYDVLKLIFITTLCVLCEPSEFLPTLLCSMFHRSL